MWKNRVLINLISALSLLFVSLDVFPALAATAPKDPPVSFRFRTPFVPSLAYAPGFVAQELYWPKLNLDGKTFPGKGSVAAVQTVAAGSEQMGYSAITAIATGIQEGLPIKIIAVVQRRDPSGLVFLKDSGIRELKDIIGKRVGSYPAGHTGPLFRTALRRAGIDERAVQIVNVPPGGDVPLLLEKKIDAVAGFAGAQDVRMGCKGYKADSIPFATFGLDIYGQAVFVNTKWAEQVGDDVVAHALLGFIQGAIVVKSTPDRAIQILNSFFPNTPQDRVAEWALVATRYPTEQSPNIQILQEKGYGWVDEGEMDRTQKVLLDSGLINKAIDLRSYYTNKYLEQPELRRAGADWVRTPWPDLPAEIKKQCGL